MIMKEYLNENNLEKLLKYLYPNTTWIKNKVIPKEIYEKRIKTNKEAILGRRLFRPDYRNEEESIVVEFDGIAHYQDTNVYFNDIMRQVYYEELGYKFIQIPYFIQPTKKVVKELFNIDVKSDLTEKKNGFNVFNGKLNKHLPASFSELGVRRFISEFNRFDIETQNEIIDTLYQNYAIVGLSIYVLPLSLIDFLSFEITEEDRKYNEHFKLTSYERIIKE